MKQITFGLLFVIVDVSILSADGQMLWWPFNNFGKVKPASSKPDDKIMQTEMTSTTWGPATTSGQSGYREYPPLPWIFTGGATASKTNSNWILDYFKRGLQNFHIPNHVSGPWLPPSISITPQPQKLIAQSIVDKGVGNSESTCDTEKYCTLALKSFATNDPLLRYAYGHSTYIEPLLQNIFEKTRFSALITPPLTIDSVIPPEVLTLSESLIKATQSKMILVVGVFTGLSVVSSALATNKDGRILAVENPDYLKYWQSVGYNFVKDSSLLDKIIIQGATKVPQYLDSLAKTQPGSFDFIILDDYDLENYKTDFSHCFELLRPNGIMLINNVFNNGRVLSGQQYRDEATKIVDDLNSKLRNDWRLVVSVLPIGNGVTLVTKK